MSPGSSTKSYPAFVHIGLRENPGKNLNQITCPDRESNPGHLVSRPDALTVTPQLGLASVGKNINPALTPLRLAGTERWLVLADIATYAEDSHGAQRRLLNDFQSSSSTSSRHPGYSEVETLGHVLVYCTKGELLRNNRHHKARSSIVTTLWKAKWEVYEEVHSLAENGSTRRPDIIAIDRRNQRSLILDPTAASLISEALGVELLLTRRGESTVGVRNKEGNAALQQDKYQSSIT
ncbi:hypothetical protein ANN_27369 [Periplaneta americana]|uniref:Uncharacterized protein n=1 Tax=Periplaneta americana TaxID=6978 RepID=A0ABQ8RYE0_PERAM|nr:hypothetical protein ANN_27369 [Periplaneta americana]